MIEGNQGDQHVEQGVRAVRARTLGEFLNETFALYGKHLWRFIGLAAAVQIPVTVLAYLLGDGPVAYGIEGVLRFFASVLMYGAVVYGVGQRYVTGEMHIGECYTRVWWRIASLSLLALVLLSSAGAGLGLAFLLIPAVAAGALMIYWSLSVQAVMVEGCKAVEALRRSFGLVRGSWWRVFGIVVVLLLVMIGLTLVVGAPFALASRLAAPTDATALSEAIQLLGGAVAVVVVPPIAAIAMTLLYYDLRVRKEGYDFTALSREMGLATI